MSRPRLLDLFCGAGGAAMGYHRAGFDVVGVDIKPQPHYPFECHQADVMALWWPTLGGFTAIHASPPCQHYSITRTMRDSRARHPDLVGPIRDRLMASGVPWVIENVAGAPLRQAVYLCGTMFGLKVFRHRWFESPIPLLVPPHSRHDGSTGATDGYSTLARGRNGYICVVGHNFNRQQGADAMGIDWPMTRQELAEAIPPAYTEFIGRQLMQALERAE